MKPKKFVKGNVAEMLAICLPMVISYACETVMIFTDRMFLSRLGPEMMNASMAGGVTVYMFMTFFLGLIGFTTALAAQYAGAGQKHKAPLVLTQAVIIAVIGYPIVQLCRPAAYFLFHHSGIAAAQLEPQVVYFNVILGFVFIPLMRHAVSCYFTGIGRTRIVMMASVLSMIVNVFANYVLIFGHFGFPALGIRGAAYGTIIGAACGLLLLLTVYFGRANRMAYILKDSFHFSSEVMRKLLRLGTPQGLEMFLNLLAFDLMVLIFHSAGAAEATAATIALNWDMLVYIPLLGVEIGVTSLVGRYMGARDITAAKQSTWSALKMALVYAGIILVTFLFFAEPLADVFHSRQADSVFQAAKQPAVFMLRLIVFYVGVQAVFVVLIGSLRGAGDTLWCMFFSVGLHWILIPVLYLMVHIFHAPVTTSWLTMISVFMLSSILLVQRYRSGKWQTLEVIAPETALLPTGLDSFHEKTDL